MKKREAVFFRNSERSFGEYAGNVGGVVRLLADAHFGVYMVSKGYGNYGLAFNGRPGVKLMRAVGLCVPAEPGIPDGEVRFGRAYTTGRASLRGLARIRPDGTVAEA